MRTVAALALLLASVGLSGCPSGVCEAGCLCISSESQCASLGCKRVYTREPSGSPKYDYCTNGPSGIYIMDASTTSDAGRS